MQQPTGRRIPAWKAFDGRWWPALALAGALTLAYWNVVFAGRSLVYSDNYNPLDPTVAESNYGKGFVPLETWTRHNWLPYPNFHDPGAVWWQGDPGTQFLRRAIAERQWPWWDPYVGGGAPAMANLTQAFFFPPQLLVAALGNASGLRNAYFLLLLLGAGLCTSWLLRRHGLGPVASCGGGLAFMLGGGLSQHAGSFVGQAAACIPYALVVTRWYVEHPTRRRAAVLAVAYAVAALASFPPVLVQVFGFAALYAVSMILAGGAGGHRVGALLRYAYGVASALGLVAFAYIPAILAMVSTRQALDLYRDVGLIRWHEASLLQLFSPMLMGGAQIFQAQLMPAMHWYYVPYAGLGVLWLAGLADRRAQGHRGPLFALAAGLAVAVAMKIVGWPPVQWLGHLPGLSSMHLAQYLGIGLNFLLAVLAGLGLENLLAGRVSFRRLVILGGLCAAALGLQLGFAVQRGVLEARVNRWLFEWSVLALLLLALVALTWLASRRRWRRFAPWAGAAALVLMGSELARHAWYPRQIRANVYDRVPEYAAVLAARGPWTRVLTFGPLPANTNSALSVPSWDSLMTFTSSRAYALYREHTKTEDTLFLRGARELPAEGVLDAAAVDVLAVLRADERLVRSVEARGNRRLFEDRRVILFERRSSPRCHFTSDYLVRSARDTVVALAAPRRERQVLLERELTGQPPVPNEPADPPAVLLTHRLNERKIRLQAPRAGLLYCAENAAEGWTARVNGTAVEIVPANSAFSALRVGPGESEVVFSYRPPGWTAGLLLSAAALLAVLGWGAFWRREPMGRL